MADTVIPKPKTDEPFEQRWGGNAYGCVRLAIPTTISEGGTNYCIGGELSVADDQKDRYVFAAEYGSGSGEGKIVHSNFGDVPSFVSSHWVAQAGFGHVSRSYVARGGDGEFLGGISNRVVPMIGRGETTFSRQGSAEGGVSEGTWDLSTTYMLTGEFKPWEHGPTMSIGTGFRQGVQFAGEASEFNRVNIEYIPIMIQIGGSDSSTRAKDSNDGGMSGAGLAQAWYSMAHGWASRYMMNATISDPLERLRNSPYHGLVDGDPNSKDRGAMLQIPVIEAGAAAAGALGDNVSGAALNSSAGMFAGLVAASTIGDAVFLASDSGTSQAAAGAGFLRSARLIGYAAAGMGTQEGRRVLSEREIERRGIYVNAASWVLNSAALVAGMAAGSDTMMKSGVAANMQVSLSPDAIGGTLVESTEIGAMPFAGVSGEKSGSRAGIVAHHHLSGAPLYTSVGVASPALIPGNVPNHLSQSEPYTNYDMNTDINVSMGPELRTRYFNISVGPSLKAVYGGGEDAQAGIGVQARTGVTVPFTKKKTGIGLSFGVQGQVHAIRPDGGAQIEGGPYVGIVILRR